MCRWSLLRHLHRYSLVSAAGLFYVCKTDLCLSAVHRGWFSVCHCSETKATIKRQNGSTNIPHCTTVLPVVPHLHRPIGSISANLLSARSTQEARFIEVTAIMVNLDELKGEILTIGETIKALKSTTPIDKDAIGAAVTSLLAAKQLYADHNNGIGVDGQPFVKDPPSKKDKKKTAAAGTETTVGDAASKQVGSFIIITFPGIISYSTCDGITQQFSSIF